MQLKLKKIYLNEADAGRDAEFRQKAIEAFKKVKDFLSGPFADEKNLKHDVGYVLTPDDLEWHDQYPDLYVVFVPENSGFRGKLLKRKNDERFFLMLSLVNDKGLEGVIQKLSSHARSFVHEFIHYLDAKRFGSSKNIHKGTASTKQKLGDRAYANTPEETNAYYQEAAYKIKEYFETLEKHRPELLEKFLMDFEQFLKKSEKMFTKGFLKALDEKNKKKILNRLYGLFENLKKEYKIQ